MSGFAGNGPKGAGRVSRFQFGSIAAGRSVFSGLDDNGLTIKMTPGLEMLIYNGALLAPSDYSVNASGSQITLPFNAGAGDSLYIIAPALQNVTNSYDKAQNGADIIDKTAFLAAIAPGAWTPFAGSPSPEAGAYGNASYAGAYQIFGKTVKYTVTINIIANGTGAGNIKFQLPVGVAARNFVGLCEEIAADGWLGYVRIGSNGSTAFVGKYDGTGFAASGRVYVCSGEYEIQ